MEHEAVDLSEPLLRAVERVRLRAAATTTFDLDVAPSVVEGDAGVLERAFVNVLDNAVKFAPASAQATSAVAASAANRAREKRW